MSFGTFFYSSDNFLCFSFFLLSRTLSNQILFPGIDSLSFFFFFTFPFAVFGSLLQVLFIFVIIF